MSFEDLADDIQLATPAKPEPRVDVNALTIRGNITKVSEALTEFDKVSAGLTDIAARYPVDLVYDVSTGKGMVEAIVHRAAWREPRLAVERLRKQAKAPVIAIGKDIDARAAYLTEQLLIGEVPIDQQIKAEEARKEAEKQERALAEFGRVQAIQDAIGEIHMDVMTAAGKPSTTIAATIEALRTATLDPLIFQELMPQAEAARAAGIAKLEIAHKAKLHDESVAASLAAERAELAELRQAAAAQKAKDAAAAQVEQARVAAEQAETARQNKAAADALAAQQAEINRQREKLEEDQREARNREELRLQEIERQRAAFEDAQRKAAEPVAVAPVEPEPAPVAAIQAAAPVLSDKSVADAAARAFVDAIAAPADTRPPIKLGDVCARLGFTMTAAFVTDTLRISPIGTDKRAVLFAASDFGRICDALVAHVAAAKAAA